MFDPNITEGEWIASTYLINGPNKEDRKALAAVPELLEVYQAAVHCIKHGFEKDLLENAIKKLEDIHCQ